MSDMIKKDLKYSMLLGYYADLLTSTQRNIMEAYYCYDNSLGEIAESLGISRQSVRGTIIKAQNAIDKYENVLKIADKTSRVMHEIDKIIEQQQDSDVRSKLINIKLILEE